MNVWMKGGDIIQEANSYNTYSKTNREKTNIVHTKKITAGLCLLN